MVKAYYLLLKKGKKGEVYNICSGNPTKLQEIISIASEIIDIDVHTEMSASLVRPNDNPLILGDNSKLKSHTGWSAGYTLKQSIEDIIEYWRNILSED